MGIKSYSTTPASNTALFPENQSPPSLNDGMRQVQADVRSWYEDAQWIDLGDTPSRASATTFKITGDVTGTYEVNRRIKCFDAATSYGTITSSSYSNPDTTIELNIDSGSLTASLTAVALSILTPTSQSIPPSIDNFGISGDFTVSGTAVFKTSFIIEGGILEVKGTSSEPGTVRLYENSDNGTNYVDTKPTESLTGNRTNTLPDRSIDFGKSTAWEFVDSATASTSSSLDFTDLDSSAAMHIFVQDGIVPVTNGTGFLVRLSTNNGSSYDSGNNYALSGIRHGEGSSTVSPMSGTGTGVSSYQVCSNLSNSATENYKAITYFIRPGNSSVKHRLFTQGNSCDAGVTADSLFMSTGTYSSGAAINAIRFQMGSGNISSGTIYHYQVRASA